MKKTPRSDRIRKSAELPFSTRSPEVPTRESTIISHSNETKSQNSGPPSLENQFFHQKLLQGTIKRENFASLTTQHLRSRREIQRENNESSTQCANFTFTIKYEDEYEVWNNFSMMYKGRMYYYNEYRVMDDGLQVCNTSETLIQEKWRSFTAREKRMTASKQCSVSMHGFPIHDSFGTCDPRLLIQGKTWKDFKEWYKCKRIVYKLHATYTVNKQFSLYLGSRGQYFTKKDYAVIDAELSICRQKLRPTSTEYTQEDLLMCNDSIINIKNDEEYNVWTNFSIIHENKVYDYTEYRVLNDGIKICNSTDHDVRIIWKLRNAWVKEKMHLKTCNEPNRTIWFSQTSDPLSKQFTLYLASTGQSFTRNDYGVGDGKQYICKEKLGPLSIEYTQEDLSMCNHSTINIKYHDQYKVWNNFSIIYLNKVYDYTEYRVLNDGIKICNSTDNHVRNIWKVRNDWVKKTMHYKSCNKPIRTRRLYRPYYTVSKQFTVYFSATNQYFTKNDYGVIDGEPHICEEKLRPESSEYTHEDLLMCNDSIPNIKYDDEYKVWNNFSILYKNKMYDYTEYRVLNDSIKICNSTDNYVRNIWKLRNDWVKKRMHLKSCNKPNRAFFLNRPYYVVSKQFTVYFSDTSQYFTKNDYGVIDGKPHICEEKLRPYSTGYTQEDLLMCNDSIINIQYDDEYNVWANFSILYKNKVYDYTEYQVLNDGIKICNSTDNYVRNIWKLGNAWVKKTMHLKSCNKPDRKIWLRQPYYFVSKQFTVYFSTTSQYFTRNDYGVIDGEPHICEEKLRPHSTEYTQDDLSMCNNPILNIKYDDEYKVRANFSILYKNKVYDYTEYRVLNDSIKICNSTDNDVRNIWKLRNDWVKKRMHLKSCNKPDRKIWLHRLYYFVSKQFTVYFSAISQYFTRNDYGVIDGKPHICEEKLRPYSTEYTKEDLLMCNNPILNIKYDDEYKVWANFSILYKNKVYDYTEYRVLNDSIKICNSTDNDVRNIWKLRNVWVKERMHLKSCNKPDRHFWLNRLYYVVSKQFTVYLSNTSQYFTRNDYGVIDGKPYICQEKLRPTSTEYTQDDLLMCNDSIITIKYDDEYKVWTNFSILYTNKVYDYTEYRVLNDSVKICNSTDNYVRNIWKLRNDWVKKTMHLKSCNKPIRSSRLNRPYYVVSKQFTVYFSDTSQYFTKNDYGVIDGEPYICDEKFRPYSTEYTQEDLLICNDSIITIKYVDEYKVWTNFSILYKNKVYDYTEYRVLNDSIKICYSTDNYVRNIWKVRNGWVKRTRHYKSCDKPTRTFWLHGLYYVVSKQFTVYLSASSQYVTRNDYGVIDGKPYICQEKLRPESSEYTHEDLLMCNDSIINIKYGDEYKVWTNFSILYKNKIYDYTKYRVLNDGIKICNSTDNDVRNIWKLRNDWVKDTMHLKSCNKPITYTEYNPGKYTVLKDFSVLIQKTNQVIPKYDYGVFGGILEICDEKLFFYISNIKIMIVPLCALALSFICLLLLLIIYCMLPELRTLPGLNLMSLSFAFLLWQTYLVAFLSLYSRVGKLLKTPCDRLFVTTKFITYSILMNAAVNIYHLRKTFCGNTLVKADVNKWKRFFKYILFSWGIPVIITIVYIILVKVDALRFDEHVVFIKKDGLRFDERIVFGKGMTKENDIRVYQHITGDCISGRITPNWSAAIDVYGFQGCLVLYILVMFFFTAYRIRQKLKASSSIAQKSNIAKNHKFVILLKLSTTTALSYWFPLFISEIVDFNFDIKIALYTVTLLTGAYIGIAFAFTRRNYTLLKKKYSPAKHKSVSKIAQV